MTFPGPRRAYEALAGARACTSGSKHPKERRMDDKVILEEKLAALDKPFQPGIVGYLNDYKLIVVKVLGGRLTIQLRDRDVELGPGELFVVPRGVEHCPKAEEEARVLLIEPKETVNTGDAGGDLTAEPVEI